MDLSAQLCTTRAKLGNVGIQIPSSQQECKKMPQKCTRQLRNATAEESTSQNLREQHQNSSIDKYTIEGNTKLAQCITGIQQAEEVWCMFQHYRAARNHSHEGGLSHLLIPAQANEDPKMCQDWK